MHDQAICYFGYNWLQTAKWFLGILHWCCLGFSPASCSGHAARVGRVSHCGWNHCHSCIEVSNLFILCPSHIVAKMNSRIWRWGFFACMLPSIGVFLQGWETDFLHIQWSSEMLEHLFSILITCVWKRECTFQNFVKCMPVDSQFAKYFPQWWLETWCLVGLCEPVPHFH